jgi:hypothetical protein
MVAMATASVASTQDGPTAAAKLVPLKVGTSMALDTLMGAAAISDELANVTAAVLLVESAAFAELGAITP